MTDENETKPAAYGIAFSLTIFPLLIVFPIALIKGEIGIAVIVVIFAAFVWGFEVEHIRRIYSESETASGSADKTHVH